MTRLPIIDGATFDPAKAGRPFDERLAALDDEAARAVIANTFANSREAAKHFVGRYAGRAYEDADPEARKVKIRDVERRIEKRRLALVST
ncbi:hypothetical protein [Sphingopyxis sp. JAI128]|uniref:hypothetical protein n=1 Tax=Sphingopyxis sp. JAI128 TaxID=2723066 RepID=UPI001615964E|nr:hypothetical protein [Sphingopyxis sp. JAI128]MBB6424627.1 hypothetical protein [Sphingopyxis sp. JAI128]